MMDVRYITPLLPGQTYACERHYLPTTSFAGGKNGGNVLETFIYENSIEGAGHQIGSTGLSLKLLSCGQSAEVLLQFLDLDFNDVFTILFMYTTTPFNGYEIKIRILYFRLTKRSSTY